jgi:3-methyladenine DNA glycosylase AlkD
MTKAKKQTTKKPTAKIKKGSAKPVELTAKKFITKLKSHASPVEVKKYSRYFKTGKGEYGEGDKFIGVRMGIVFALAKEFIDMPLSEVEKLLESGIHEVRAGGMSIMNQQARKKKTPESRRKELYDLYIRRHDRINNWDLVDVSAPYVVGGYLYVYKKPRNVLYKLAKSKNLWERRSAILSTGYFIKQGNVDDTHKIAEILLNDKEDLIHKAVGWMLRASGGGANKQKLLKFLDKHAGTMPRTLLRYSLEHLDKKQREHYMSLKKKS